MTKKKPHGHNFGGTSKQKRRKENKSKWVFRVTNSKVFGCTHSKDLICTWIYVPLDDYLVIFAKSCRIVIIFTILNRAMQ